MSKLKLKAVNDKYIEMFLKDNNYFINENNEIYSFISKQGHPIDVPRKIELKLNKGGYFSFQYGKKGRGNRRNLLFHRIVYAKFIGKLDENLCINHKNGIRTDNRTTNLELVTYSYNNYHSFEKLNRKPSIGNFKISKAIALEIKKDKLNRMKIVDIKKKYGIGKTTIYYIMQGKIWK